jgi:hypothetical protein
MPTPYPRMMGGNAATYESTPTATMKGGKKRAKTDKKKRRSSRKHRQSRKQRR